MEIRPLPEPLPRGEGTHATLPRIRIILTNAILLVRIICILPQLWNRAPVPTVDNQVYEHRDAICFYIEFEPGFTAPFVGPAPG